MLVLLYNADPIMGEVGSADVREWQMTGTLR